MSEEREQAQEVAAAAEADPTPAPAQHSIIDDLFGAASPTADDPFAQLGAADDQAQVELEQPAQAEIGQDSGNGPSDPVPPSHPEPVVDTETHPKTPAETAPAPLQVEDKDFSDLLAEFEAEHGDVDRAETNVVAAGPEEEQHAIPSVDTSTHLQHQPVHIPAATDQLAATNQQTPPAATASALFSDETNGPSTFDDLLAQPDFEAPLPIPSSGNASPSPVPSLSIEHSRISDQAAPDNDSGNDHAGDVSVQSMFSNASDWLGDTTIDESYIADAPAGKAHKEDEGDGDAPLGFEVPQGWYDENGEWNWYTDEEKEQVRLAMLGQGANGETTALQEPEPIPQSSTPALPYSPALHTPSMSENAARRTPQPESAPTMPSHSYDAYAPSSAQTSSMTTSTYSGMSSSTYSSQPSPYGPTSTASISPYAPMNNNDSYAPTTSAATPSPYAPPTQASALNPYGSLSQASGYLPQAGPSTQSAPPVATKPAPPKIQRMTSNAYDPPFLRSQKSFVRPAAVPAASPAYGAPLATAMSPPMPSAATPPPPPSGPPRKATTEARPASRGPTYAAPPPKGPPRASSTVSQAYGQDQHDNAPPRPPSVAASQRSLGPHDAYDPPLLSISRRQSHDQHQQHATHGAPPRSPSAMSRASFASPPPRTASPSLAPPPAVSSPYAPSRPLSRGPPKRQQSPFFAAPPPRHDVTQRMRSPPQPHQPSFEQVLSPLQTSEPLREAEEPPQTLYESQRTDNDYSGQQSNKAYQPYANGTDTHMSSLSPVSSPRREEFPALSRRYDEEGEELEASYGPSSQSGSYQGNHASQYHEDRGSYQQHKPAHQPTVSDPYMPSSLGLMSLDPSRKDQSAGYTPYTPHAPPQNSIADRADDPYAPNASQLLPATDSYAPTQTSPQKSHSQHPPRAPSSYEPSPYSPQMSKPVSIAPPADPYARVASPAYSTGYGMSPPTNNYFQSMHQHQGSMDETYVPQQVLEQRPVSEDPLGRCTLAARNAPLAVFGFGGVLITAFPGTAESGDFHKGHSRGPSYGYASGRGQLWIKSVSDVAVPTALKGDHAAFPGPLIFDASIAKGAAGDKKKREAVLGYLEARAEEIEKGLPYLKSSASRARRDEEGRLVLVRLLRALVIGEGKLAGNPQVEEAVQAALANPSSPNMTTAPVGSAAPISDTNGFPSLYPSTSSDTNTKSAKASSAQLDHISWLLTHGNKRDAASYAADQGLWSHALVISSCVDPELWKDLVGRFARAELSEISGAGAIKASYALFSGVTSSSVDDLISAASITDDPSKDQWREVVSAVLHNGNPTDLACLDELGSRFQSMKLTTAAQVCFLLSPSSPFFDSSLAAYDRPLALLQNPRDEEAVIYAEIAEYARSLAPAPAVKGQEALVALPQLLPYKLARAWRLAELGEVEQAQKYCTAIDASSKIKNGPSLLSGVFAASLEDLLERLTGTPSIDPPNAFGSGRKAKPGLDKIGSWIEGRLTKFIAGEEDGLAPPAASKPSDKTKQGPFAHFSAISPNGSGAITRNASTADFGGVAPNGYLGVGGPGGGPPSSSRSTSPAAPTTSAYGASTSPASSYGEQYGSHFGAAAGGGGGGYNSWSAGGAGVGGAQDNHERYGSYGAQVQDQSDYQPYTPDPATGDSGEFINPMAQLSLNDEPQTNTYDYKPSQRPVEDDDDDDLGFGNAALSRDKTPRPGSGSGAASNGAAGAGGGEGDKAEASKSAQKDNQKGAASPAKPEHKSSWLGKWWGKKEGEGPGPVKANLGEESSMVFDPELKRWIVKGAKPDTTPTSTPPPPPRAQTASPSRSARPEQSISARAMSATPPPSRAPPSGLSMSSAHGPPSGGLGGFAETPDGGIRRMKSSLAESVTASDLPSAPSSAPPAPGAMGRPPPPPGSGGNGPPSRPPTAGPPKAAAGAPSIDDLLSRPPSKRPASAAARKGARNRYVDVFQPGAEGQ